MFLTTVRTLSVSLLLHCVNDTLPHYLLILEFMYANHDGIFSYCSVINWRVISVHENILCALLVIDLVLGSQRRKARKFCQFGPTSSNFERNQVRTLEMCTDIDAI
jgi:hypothetical protein